MAFLRRRLGRAQQRRQVGARVIVTGLLAAIIAILTNVATGVLPDAWSPHLWLAWPALAAVLLLSFLVPTGTGDSQRNGARKVKPGRERRNRLALLRRVRALWIEGVLEHSIYRRMLLDLGLEHRNELLNNPWDALIEWDGGERQSARGVSLISVLDSQESLLILGAPGAGKSTTILGLAQELLDRVEREGTEVAISSTLLPVVFRLATWSSNDRTLADWLVNELTSDLYGIDQELAEKWVNEDQILPLLDGLDEVEFSRRAACLTAINEFHRSHPLTPLVVTSRLTDYTNLDLKLRLRTALVLQPLTRSQVDDYLAGLNDATEGLRQALSRQPAMWEVLNTPLMLSIAVRSYQGLSASEVPTGGSLDERRTNLFDAFIRRSLQPKPGAKKPYDGIAARRWLAYLARALGQQLGDIFVIDLISQSWLPSRLRKISSYTVSLISGPIIGVGAGLISALILAPPLPVVVGVIFGLTTALVNSSAAPYRLPRFHSSTRRGHVLSVLGDSLPGGIGIGIAAAFTGALIGAVSGFILGWTTSFGVFSGLLYGMAAGALVLGYGGFLLGCGIDAGGFETGATRADTESAGSISGAVWATIGIFVLIGTIAAILLSAFNGPSAWLTGVLVGLSVADRAVGRFLVRYGLVRLLLRASGLGPLRYVHFLDYATREAILVQVGRGYLFGHRLLLEYFASLNLSGVGEGGFSAVDLRPAQLLREASSLSETRPSEAARRLRYALDYLAARDAAPVAISIARSLEGLVLANAARIRSTRPSTEEWHTSDWYTLNRDLKEAINVYRLAIRLGDPPQGTEARFRLAELMREAMGYSDLTDRRSYRFRAHISREEIVSLYRTAAQAGHAGASAALRDFDV